MLTKEEILGLDDLGTIEVVVPEWGGKKVKLKAMSALERDSYELEVFNERETARKESRPLTNLRARYLVRCIVNADGKRLFADGDAPALGAKSGKALDRLYDEARKLNGNTAEEAEAIVKS